MSDYVPLIGRIRALEAKLLNENRLERMVGADSPQEAFRVLTELQYAEFIDENTVADNFQDIIRQGLIESRNLTTDYLEADDLFLLWGRFDFNNLSRSLKWKYHDGKTELSEDEVDPQGFSRLGTIPYQSILAAINDNDLARLPLPESLRQTAQMLRDQLEAGTADSWQEIDRQLEMSVFRAQSATVAQRSVAVKTVFEAITQTHNFRNLIRYFVAHQALLPASWWLPNDPISYEQFSSEPKNLEALLLPYQNHPLGIALAASKSDASVAAEEISRNYIHPLLKKEAVGCINDFIVVWNYVFTRLRNAEIIRFVMFAKFQGVDQKQIFTDTRRFSFALNS